MVFFHIRWMILRDMPQVLAIEAESFDHPWSDDDFMKTLRQRNCIGMVAELDERVIGFMIYELQKNRLHVVNFAVHAAWRRQGVGQGMVEKLLSKLTVERRNQVLLEVRETNLDAQLFFRDMGFRAIAIINDNYRDSDEDAYLFQYRVNKYSPTLTEI